VEVSVPSAEQEAARDLVRAREDCRGDLMSARHRLSKLLLQQGVIYSGGGTWTGKHELWLQRQRFDAPALQLTYDTALDTMLATVDRRKRLDEAIAKLAADSAYTPVDRPLDRCLPGSGAHRVQLGGFPLAGGDHQDWQRPRPPAAYRGGLASPPVLPTRNGDAAPLGSGGRWGGSG